MVITKRQVLLLTLILCALALKACNITIELKPDSPDFAVAWYNRACVYSIKGEKEKALSDLKRAIGLDVSYKDEAKTDEDFKRLVE
jgi:tetratricopeptide (TPR) repeat protein